MLRKRASIRAGQQVTAPDGTVVVLPKDWEDLSVAELTAMGLGPGQPPGATVAGFIPAAELPLRLRLLGRTRRRR